MAVRWEDGRRTESSAVFLQYIEVLDKGLEKHVML